jgi:catechol 2,3-dioxygenase-like lactoylglutathione lyase family enzyme
MAVKDHMVSRTHIPRPPLSDFVEVFWQYDGLDPSHARERCLPTGTMEIVVDLPLASLRLGLEFEHEGLVAFGSGESGRLIIYASERPVAGFHVAFSAPSREAVDRFHAAALEAGGRDNGAPGLRPEYHEGYYGAYVFDPDGNNIEAVQHTVPPDRTHCEQRTR